LLNLNHSDQDMPTFDGSNSLAFFKALHRDFCETLTDEAQHRDPIDGLLEDCFETFDRNSENAYRGACRGGCASCCAIRVAATAPEILLIARTLRSSSGRIGFELWQKIEAADRPTRRIDEQGRMNSGLPCPFVDGGLCVIYAVRPLACRGHVSYDQQACIDPAAARQAGRGSGFRAAFDGQMPGAECEAGSIARFWLRLGHL
jgi:Fe-S-cluster containining protein